MKDLHTRSCVKGTQDDSDVAPALKNLTAKPGDRGYTTGGDNMCWEHKRWPRGDANEATEAGTLQSPFGWFWMVMPRIRRSVPLTRGKGPTLPLTFCLLMFLQPAEEMNPNLWEWKAFQSHRTQMFHLLMQVNPCQVSNSQQKTFVRLFANSIKGIVNDPGQCGKIRKCSITSSNNWRAFYKFTPESQASGQANATASRHHLPGPAFLPRAERKEAPYGPALPVILKMPARSRERFWSWDGSERKKKPLSLGRKEAVNEPSSPPPMSLPFSAAATSSVDLIEHRCCAQHHKSCSLSGTEEHSAVELPCSWKRP